MSETKAEAKAEPKEAKVKKDAAPKVAEANATPQQQARSEKKVSRWNATTCAKAAKRFHSRSEWAHGAPSSYKAAAAKGWLDQCCGHMSEPVKKAPARLKKTA